MLYQQLPDIEPAAMRELLSLLSVGIYPRKTEPKLSFFSRKRKLESYCECDI